MKQSVKDKEGKALVAMSEVGERKSTQDDDQTWPEKTVQSTVPELQNAAFPEALPFERSTHEPASTQTPRFQVSLMEESSADWQISSARSRRAQKNSISQMDWEQQEKKTMF